MRSDPTNDSKNSDGILVSQLEQLAAQGAEPLPSVRQFFGVGRLMFRFDGRDSPDLPLAYQHLVESLPETYLKKAFAAYQSALSALVQSTKPKSAPGDDLTEAAESLCGFFSSSPLLCRVAYSIEWISSLAALYDRLAVGRVRERSDAVLSSVSFLLLDGLFMFAKGNPNFEDCLLQAIQAVEEQSVDCLHDLQEWQLRHEPFRRTLETSVRKLPPITQKEADENNIMQLREYILDMLESARQKQETKPLIDEMESSQNTTKIKTTAATEPKPVSAADELERRIQQVKQILPDFGEGFLESALSLHQGNVEATVSALIGDPSQYPPSLRMLDKNLPRRRKLRSDEEAEETAQARQLVKDRVAAEEQREQERYNALLYMAEREAEQERQLAPGHDEYDDDYDDQYDEIDVKLGGADDGMYDFEQVKLYNQVARAEEADNDFWEENRNTNRPLPVGPKNVAGPDGGGKKYRGPDGGGKKYRGPDKVKGGRIVGADGKVVKNNNRGRGAKKPNGTNNSDANKNAAQANATGAQKGQKAKPKTKPKSSNKINRQRDKKHKAQGTFGTES